MERAWQWGDDHRNRDRARQGGLSHIALAVAAALVMFVAAGCGKHIAIEPDAESDSLVALLGSDPEQASSSGADATAQPSTRYAVPDASPEQLLEFIAEISRRAPLGDTETQRTEDLVQLLLARVQACDRILAQQPLESIAATAHESRLDALRALAIVDPSSHEGEFLRTVDQLTSSGDGARELLGHVARARWEVERLGNGRSSDVDAVIGRLNDLIDKHPDEPMVFWGAVYAGSILQGLGHDDATVELYSRAAQAFSDSESADVAAEARMLVGQAQSASIESHAAAAIEGDQQALVLLRQMVDRLLTDSGNDTHTLSVCTRAANVLEFAGLVEPAAQLYDAILARYGDHTDAMLAESVRHSVELARKRLNLKGQPFECAAVTLDGQPFDWSAYSGKRLLVDFWTTQQPPASMADLRQVYQQYRDAGLQVVGVCLDGDVAQCRSYLRSHRLPWTVVMQPGIEGPEAAESVVDRYGIETAPFRMLVEPDGTIAQGNLIGERLDEVLQQVYSPPEQ